MTMVSKQNTFARKISILIMVAQEMGYQVTLGHAWRSPGCKVGHPKSNHKKRLAEDLNLFLDGEYLIDGRGHNELHDIWDKMGGAERIESDLNHYSLLHKGIR